MDKLLDAAAVEIDEGKRRELLEQAGTLFNNDRVALPLVIISSAWAMRKDKVDLPKPRADEDTLAFDVAPAN